MPENDPLESVVNLRERVKEILAEHGLVVANFAVVPGEHGYPHQVQMVALIDDISALTVDPEQKAMDEEFKRMEREMRLDMDNDKMAEAKAKAEQLAKEMEERLKGNGGFLED